MTNPQTSQFATKWLDEKGKLRNHVCLTCMYEWPLEKKWFRYPLHFKFVRRGDYYPWWWPRRWGIEWGSDKFWRIWYKQVIAWGRLRIVMGPNYTYLRPNSIVCPNCGAIYWKEDRE